MNKGFFLRLSSLLIGLGIIIRVSAITSAAVTISYTLMVIGIISLGLLLLTRGKR